MAATVQQVQNFVDQRVRPRCEQIRALYLSCKDDKASFDDVYETVNVDGWADDRKDGPPHLLTSADVLAWNTFITAFISLMEGDFKDLQEALAAKDQYPIVLKSCVRAVTIE